MLILTRRIGETLVVNDNIQVMVLGVKGNQVRLGINAPKEISIHRDEIYQKILAERESDTSNVSVFEMKIQKATGPIKLVKPKRSLKIAN